jgi:hypothetical protein
MTTYNVIIETVESLPDGTPLVRELIIRGSVTDSKGMPVPNASVRIIEPDINDIGEGMTDGMGKFVITVGDDTMHHVYINEMHCSMVKVLAKGKDC